MPTPPVTDKPANDADKDAAFVLRKLFPAPELLAIIILLLGILVTAGLWHDARKDAHAALRKEFDFEVDQIAQLIEKRMATYEQVQRGVQAFLLGSLDVNSDDFRLYVESLRLPETYPGIQGIAISQVVRPDKRHHHEEAIRA